MLNDGILLVSDGVDWMRARATSLSTFSIGSGCIGDVHQSSLCFDIWAGDVLKIFYSRKNSLRIFYLQFMFVFHNCKYT